MKTALAAILISTLSLTYYDHCHAAETPEDAAEIKAVYAADDFRFDGRPVEDFWQNAVPAADFVQMELHEGRPESEHTEVRIASDSDNIYVAVRCYDSEPEKIVRNEMRRDVDLDSDDNFMMVIDTFGSLRNGYFFTVNPNGARYDGIFYGTELLNPDWDGVWDAKARVDEEGWTAEIVIPFKTLRFPPAQKSRHGVSISNVSSAARARKVSGRAGVVRMASTSSRNRAGSPVLTVSRGAAGSN